jgi:hypothetical protein
VISHDRLLAAHRTLHAHDWLAPQHDTVKKVQYSEWANSDKISRKGAKKDAKAPRTIDSSCAFALLLGAFA